MTFSIDKKKIRTQEKVHPVFDQLVVALAWGWGTLREPGSSRDGGGLRLVRTFGGPEVSGAEPEGDGVQDGSPRAAVVQTRRVDGLGSVERAA